MGTNKRNESPQPSTTSQNVRRHSQVAPCPQAGTMAPPPHPLQPNRRDGLGAEVALDGMARVIEVEPHAADTDRRILDHSRLGGTDTAQGDERSQAHGGDERQRTDLDEFLMNAHSRLHQTIARVRGRGAGDGVRSDDTASPTTSQRVPPKRQGVNPTADARFQRQAVGARRQQAGLSAAAVPPSSSFPGSLQQVPCIGCTGATAATMSGTSLPPQRQYNSISTGQAQPSETAYRQQVTQGPQNGTAPTQTNASSPVQPPTRGRPYSYPYSPPRGTFLWSPTMGVYVFGEGRRTGVPSEYISTGSMNGIRGMFLRADEQEVARRGMPQEWAPMVTFTSDGSEPEAVRARMFPYAQYPRLQRSQVQESGGEQYTDTKGQTKKRKRKMTAA